MHSNLPQEDLSAKSQTSTDGNPVAASATSDTSGGIRADAMSYKFQRLREKLREAIRSGELADKLPGERALAKRFHVNAKTLSKALTDLAAEGLLDRSIGRGTYVKGSAPMPQADGRWLVLCDDGEADACLVAHLREMNGQIEVVNDVTRLRPSFLNQFSAVIDASAVTPEGFLRDLVVRNLPIVAVGHEPRTYSVHSVLADVALGAAKVGRDLLLAGHKRIAVVERRGSTLLADALRQSARRYAPDAVVDACLVDDVAQMLGDGPVAIVCDSAQTARTVRGLLERCGKSVPQDVSLAAVGYACERCGPNGTAGHGHPCSGNFVNCRQLTEAAIRLLRESPNRPTTLWLVGESTEAGTIDSSTSQPQEDAPADRPLHMTGVLVY